MVLCKRPDRCISIGVVIMGKARVFVSFLVSRILNLGSFIFDPGLCGQTAEIPC